MRGGVQTPFGSNSGAGGQEFNFFVEAGPRGTREDQGSVRSILDSDLRLVIPVGILSGAGR